MRAGSFSRLNPWCILLVLLVGSCASVPSPSPVATVPFAAVPPKVVDLDTAEFRAVLEKAHESIVQHEAIAGSLVAASASLPAAPSIEIPDHRSVHSAINLFSNDLHGDIQKYLSRCSRYQKLIEKHLVEEHLPRELLYLPVIESGYSPTMTSRSGAHGIWQFMPETAREYGLRVDWWVDERADPERSTRAAARYLKDLYRQFHDWPLALAAYNCGPGAIRRALRRSGASTFWELLESSEITAETKGYVPTFLATVAIASNPSNFGFHLEPPLPNDHDSIEIEGPVSLGFVARVAAISEEQLRAANPSLRQGLVPPGRARLSVPRTAAAALRAQATTLKQADDRMALSLIQLREGESLEQMARDTGVPLATILAANQLSSPDQLSAGDRFYVPVKPERIAAVRSGENLHTVRKGETFYSIALDAHVTVNELIEINGLQAEHQLRPGEKLRTSDPHIQSAGGGM